LVEKPAAICRKLLTGSFCALLSLSLNACSPEAATDKDITANTRIELVDWHISGLWVINSPVCWIRVSNYNAVPIKEVTVNYTTYDYDGKPLDHGNYTIDGEVPPGTAKNFIELYIGLVNVDSDQLSVTLESAKQADGH
jgi:hypothetical protein